MSKAAPNHQPATLGDVRAHVPTLTQLLAGAEFPCPSQCEDGRIDNADAVRAWEEEHRETLEGYRAERRRTRSAWVTPEESALEATRPPWFLPCPCRGTGFILTEQGHALVAFVLRHLGGGDDDRRWRWRVPAVRLLLVWACPRRPRAALGFRPRFPQVRGAVEAADPRAAARQVRTPHRQEEGSRPMTIYRADLTGEYRRLIAHLLPGDRLILQWGPGEKAIDTPPEGLWFEVFNSDPIPRICWYQSESRLTQNTRVRQRPPITAAARAVRAGGVVYVTCETRQEADRFGQPYGPLVPLPSGHVPVESETDVAVVRF